MRNVSVVVSLTLVAAILFLRDVEAGQGFNSEEANTSMLSCVEYLIGGRGDHPSPACCNAVSHLIKASTPTRNERIAACKCLKDAITNIPGIREDLAAALPKRCGVVIDFKITKNINCDAIPSARESGRWRI